MMVKESESELYLRYPLKIQWECFTVTITQTGRGFITQLTYDTLLDVIFIRPQVSHLTLHLAILWANNELDCLVAVNTEDEEEDE